VDDTVPPGLRISLEVQVSAERQEAMDELVNKATKDFHRTVMDGLLRVRRDEVNAAKQDLQEACKQHDLEVDQVFQLMTAEDLAPSAAEVTQWKRHFQNTKDRTIKEIRTLDFQQRLQKIEKQQERDAARANRRLDAELRDPAMEAMEERLKQLEKKVRDQSKTPQQASSKNQQARSDRGKPDAGQKKEQRKARSNAEQKKGEKNSANRLPKKPAEGKGKSKGKGKENPKRRSA
jgi:hypothetical protein